MNGFRFYDRPVLAEGRNIVGIDIGKNKHSAVAISSRGEKLASLTSFTNDRDGIDRLEAQVLKPAGGPHKVLFALEATGHYWMAIYHELIRRGYRGVVLNPIQTNGEARTRIRKTKTDNRDAEGIARFILTGKAHATRIPDEAVAELRVLTRRRQQLLQMKGNIERGAQSLTDRVFPEYDRCFCKPFLASARAMIRTVGFSPREIAGQEETTREVLTRVGRGRLKTEIIDGLIQHARDSIGTRQAEQVVNNELRATINLIESFESQIAELDLELEKRMEIMKTPLFSLGIGASLAAMIHAESDPASDFPSGRQYAAYAGLDPSTYDSGEMHGTRTHISKRGSPYLRYALYLGAFSVYQKHDYFHKIYRRFCKTGHKHTDALIIVARHLALVVWRMLRDNRPFTKRPPKRN
ncbi:MAG: IS110 family transposase [Deltaproteobacteria bacterium]|nr:IS110 family transposase [Deltaproteobacteria bacterium]